MRKFYIVMAVIYSIVAALFVAATCIYASDGNMACTIVYAICTAIWGGLAGYWICEAVFCKDYEFYRDGYYEKCHELMESRHELIEKNFQLIEKNKQFIKLIEAQIKEEINDER